MFLHRDLVIDFASGMFLFLNVVFCCLYSVPGGLGLGFRVPGVFPSHLARVPDVGFSASLA